MALNYRMGLAMITIVVAFVFPGLWIYVLSFRIIQDCAYIGIYIRHQSEHRTQFTIRRTGVIRFEIRSGSDTMPRTAVDLELQFV